MIISALFYIIYPNDSVYLIENRNYIPDFSSDKGIESIIIYSPLTKYHKEISVKISFCVREKTQDFVAIESMNRFLKKKDIIRHHKTQISNYLLKFLSDSICSEKIEILRSKVSSFDSIDLSVSCIATYINILGFNITISFANPAVQYKLIKLNYVLLILAFLSLVFIFVDFPKMEGNMKYLMLLLSLLINAILFNSEYTVVKTEHLIPFFTFLFRIYMYFYMNNSPIKLFSFVATLLSFSLSFYQYLIMKDSTSISLMMTIPGYPLPYILLELYFSVSIILDCIRNIIKYSHFGKYSYITLSFITTFTLILSTVHKFSIKYFQIEYLSLLENVSQILCTEIMLLFRHPTNGYSLLNN